MVKKLKRRRQIDKNEISIICITTKMTVQKTNEMDQYEKETGKYAIWRGITTEGFKKWQRGEKIYDRDKERISLYVSEDVKSKWQEFVSKNQYSSISKLIRDSVDLFIEHQINGEEQGEKINIEDNLADISPDLREALTSIKGYSQFLVEEYDKELNPDVLEKIQIVFNKSVSIENKLKQEFENKRVNKIKTDILLIDSDRSIINLLTSFFEGRGFTCRGVVSASKGLEELKTNLPKLILVDLNLPDIEGQELSRIIRSRNEFDGIPIFILSPFSSYETGGTLAESSVDGYLLKPFDLKDFEILFKYL